MRNVLTKKQTIEMFESVYGQLYRTKAGRYYWIDDEFACAHYVSWASIKSRAYEIYEKEYHQGYYDRFYKKEGK